MTLLSSISLGIRESIALRVHILGAIVGMMAFLLLSVAIVGFSGSQASQQSIEITVFAEPGSHAVGSDVSSLLKVPLRKIATETNLASLSLTLEESEELLNELPEVWKADVESISPKVLESIESMASVNHVDLDKKQASHWGKMARAGGILAGILSFCLLLAYSAIVKNRSYPLMNVATLQGISALQTKGLSFGLLVPFVTLGGILGLILSRRLFENIHLELQNAPIASQFTLLLIMVSAVTLVSLATRGRNAR